MGDMLDSINWAPHNEGPDYQRQVSDWLNGFHTTREGEEIKLKDMTDSHLKNTINFFKELDTSVLEEELNNREEGKE